MARAHRPTTPSDNLTPRHGGDLTATTPRGQTPARGLNTSAGPVAGRAPRHGTLTVVTGPMYSGKSSGVVERVERMARASRHALVLRPVLDTRTESLHTHAGRAVPAGFARYVAEARVPVLPPRHRDAAPTVAWPRIGPEVRLVALDEVQFLPAASVTTFITAALARGVDVVCAGLDLDSRGRPFDTMAALLALADAVEKRTAVCVCCGADARRSQRLTADPARVVVGGAGDYEARCTECWVPDEE